MDGSKKYENILKYKIDLLLFTQVICGKDHYIDIGCFEQFGLLKLLAGAASKSLPLIKWYGLYF
jgi:hypothetical protein